MWFQPIIDTLERRILAHECILHLCGVEPDNGGQTIEDAWVRSLAIHSAARQAKQGLYFFRLVPSSIHDPDLDMCSTLEAIVDSGMPPGNVVFEVVESDLARDPADTHRIREYLRRNGLGFAVSRAGVGAGADLFEAVCNCAPDYINLDGRLVRDIDQPACSPMIGKLVQMAEKSGARVVARGVDCFRILKNLLLSGVQLMQGRLFGEPPAVSRLLDDNGRWSNSGELKNVLGLGAASVSPPDPSRSQCGEGRRFPIVAGPRQ